MSATLTSVTPTTSSGVLVAAKGSRHTLTFHNDTNANVYIAADGTCSTTTFTTLLAPGDYYESPCGIQRYSWSCILASGTATGAVRVTEG